MSGEGRGVQERPVETQHLSFSPCFLFNCLAQKFFVLTAPSPSGFDPDDLGYVCACAHIRARARAGDVCAHIPVG